jgi:hypothetical protein
VSRLRAWLANAWYYRPVLTTFATLDERDENGFVRGLLAGADDAGRIYQAGYDAGAGNLPAPKPRGGHAARTTSTGRTLVAVV